MNTLISIEFGKLSVVGISLNSVSNVQKESLKQSPYPVIFTELHVVHYSWTLSLLPDPPLPHLHPHSRAEESLWTLNCTVFILISK
uniref:Uncharacterized protein n=1 Tax=Aotus nancymaae TaxID=37293 RepID=A0A2K5EVA3_AOTNA